ncbi:AAA+ ATPase domain-containing protein [Bordetella sputigena]|uniref:HAD hydrolase family protein n=1 Tax=Bordetella sputigena TaxID=1416810 RepID=UPI0039EF0318
MMPSSMFFLALATDYDGTIAQFGAVDAATRKSLDTLKRTGRRLILVTGRELAELRHAFPALGLFDLVVAENGAVLHDPASGETHLLAAPPPKGFIEKLITRGVQPLSVGSCIVATWEPHQAVVLETIKEFGLELKIVFNKGAIMILPADVTKATGLREALTRLDISRHNVVGVGDAENDHAFLRDCGCAAAVANALPAIKADADVVLEGDHGAGVGELIRRLIDEDTKLIAPRRLGLRIGLDREGRCVRILPNQHVLVMGDTGCGKSRFAKMLTERMAQAQFEFCVIDPEGDYHDLEDAVAISEGPDPPRSDEAIRLLRKTGVNVVVNTVSLDLAARRKLVGDILGPISALKARSGRPHWLIVDEAHQFFSGSADGGPRLPAVFPATLFLSVCPENLTADILGHIDVVVAFGPAGVDKFANLRGLLGCTARPRGVELHDGEALVWLRDPDQALVAIRPDAPRQRHHRHLGKYAVGDVGAWHSFYFRGPDNSGGQRARNIWEFATIIPRLDAAVWEHHLRAHDYSTWFRNVIKDEDIAREAEKIEDDTHLSAMESRHAISRMLLARYAAPADTG